MKLRHSRQRNRSTLLLCVEIVAPVEVRVEDFGWVCLRRLLWMSVGVRRCKTFRHTLFCKVLCW